MSIIIPAINEAENLNRLLPYLQAHVPKADVEIFVSDGGSKDHSSEIIHKHNVKLINSPQKGRAFQMHYATQFAKGSILYFVHADVLPPTTFYGNILLALDKGKKAGCFSFQFDQKSKLLNLNAKMTHFQTTGSGGGDQTLFILRDVYDELGGFNSSMSIMEDFEFAGRIKSKFDLHIIKNDAIVSSRKYSKNSWLKVQYANSYVFLAYKLGASQEFLARKYKSLLNE